MKKYSVVWYSDNSFNERIDVIEDVSKYNILDTSDCTASYIKGSDERYFGDQSMIDLIQSTKLKASILHVPDVQEPCVKDGKFYITTSKVSEDDSVEYKKVLVNGKLELEYYRNGAITVELDMINNQVYDSTSRPVNYEDYVVAFGIQTSKGNTTVRTTQAEFYPYEELLRMYPQVKHVLDPINDYVVVGSYEEAVERLRIWKESKEQLKSFDIESYSVDWGPDSSNRITGVFLGIDEHWSTYFPFRQEAFKYNLPIEFLREIFETINSQPPAPEVIIIAHNVKFEIEGFYQEYRERIRFDVDTYLLAVLVDPNVKKGTHTLKALTAKYDGKFYLTLEQIFIGPVKFNVLPESIVKLYGCPDATSPAKIFKALMQELPKDEHFIMQLEMKLPYIKGCHNEFYGIRMDMPLLNKLIENEQYKVNLLKDMFCKIHKTSKNINSYDVMSEILYYKLRCPVVVTTDRGLPATSKKAIDHIVAGGKIEITEDTVIPQDIVDLNGKVIIKGKELAGNKYPSLVIYQTYKKCMKELGALNRLKNHSVNGFFKFYINQLGAASSRQTSDAHQFSDTMKKCAVADSPHHRLVSCDWSQVELRILAGMAKELPLLELEKQPGVDIHRAVCSIIKKTPMYLISEEDRKKAKPVNFGVVYMMSEYGMASGEYGPKYTKAQLAEVRQRMMDFFNGLPCIKEFIHNNEVYLRENGFIKTAFCYYRYFKELLDPTITEKRAMKYVRAGNNTPVQGTGAALMKIAEDKVDQYMQSKGWLKEKNYDGRMLPMARMILPVHDEILGSFDKDIPIEEIITMFKDCMELEVKGMPPFFATPAFVENWYEGKNSVWEVPIELRDQVVEEYRKGNLLFGDRDYLEVVTEFRNNEIRDYMYGLISKYKTADAVAEHVTHDSLTHTLIEAMMPDKDERKKLTHIERIHEATRRYMEQLDSGEMDRIVATINEEEEDEVNPLMEVDEWVEGYARVSADGDLIVEDVSTEDAEYYADSLMYDEVEGYSENIETPSAIYLMNECIIDLTHLTEEQTELFNQKIQEITSPSGFYTVVYILGHKTLKTPLKIDYKTEDITSILTEVLGG